MSIDACWPCALSAMIQRMASASTGPLLCLAREPAVRVGGVSHALGTREAALLAWLAIEGPTSRADLASALARQRRRGGAVGAAPAHLPAAPDRRRRARGRHADACAGRRRDARPRRRRLGAGRPQFGARRVVRRLARSPAERSQVAPAPAARRACRACRGGGRARRGDRPRPGAACPRSALGGRAPPPHPAALPRRRAAAGAARVRPLRAAPQGRGRRLAFARNAGAAADHRACRVGAPARSAGPGRGAGAGGRAATAAQGRPRPRVGPAGRAARRRRGSRARRLRRARHGQVAAARRPRPCRQRHDAARRAGDRAARRRTGALRAGGAAGARRARRLPGRARRRAAHAPGAHRSRARPDRGGESGRLARRPDHHRRGCSKPRPDPASPASSWTTCSSPTPPRSNGCRRSLPPARGSTGRWRCDRTSCGHRRASGSTRCSRTRPSRR